MNIFYGNSIETVRRKSFLQFFSMISSVFIKALYSFSLEKLFGNLFLPFIKAVFSFSVGKLPQNFFLSISKLFFFYFLSKSCHETNYFVAFFSKNYSEKCYLVIFQGDFFVVFSKNCLRTIILSFLHDFLICLETLSRKIFF